VAVKSPWRKKKTSAIQCQQRFLHHQSHRSNVVSVAIGMRVTAFIAANVAQNEPLALGQLLALGQPLARPAHREACGIQKQSKEALAPGQPLARQAHREACGIQQHSKDPLVPGQPLARPAHREACGIQQHRSSACCSQRRMQLAHQSMQHLHLNNDG